MPGRHRRPQPFIPGPATSDPAAGYSPQWEEPSGAGYSPQWEEPPATGCSPQWEEPLAPLDSLAPHWDPTEELAHLLREAAGTEADSAPVDEPSDPGTQFASDEGAFDGLPEATAELPRQRSAPPRRRTRTRTRTRSRARKRAASGMLRITSRILGAVAALVVSVVCVFGAMVSYAPLRNLAVHRTSASTLDAWPLLIYGPWIVASVSVLRAGLHRRRAAHSWAVVLLFSTVAMVLCVAQAAHRPLDAAAAALPALAALACFQQLIRQITLSRPPRQSHPRHRFRRTSSASPPATEPA
ncbi:DUF2637 domain-containing protein [Streptomyces kunmingensis]